jgi:uncharacterized OB-fold protein
VTTPLKHPPAPEAVVVDPWTAPYWEATRRRELTVCRCGDCGEPRLPPGPFCPRCQSQAVRWERLPGTGSLYTYTVIRRGALPAHAASVPYAPAVIALDGVAGVRIISAVVDCDDTALAVGMPVRVVWHELADGNLTPFFTPA